MEKSIAALGFIIICITSIFAIARGFALDKWIVQTTTYQRGLLPQILNPSETIFLVENQQSGKFGDWKMVARSELPQGGEIEVSDIRLQAFYNLVPPEGYLDGSPETGIVEPMVAIYNYNYPDPPQCHPGEEIIGRMVSELAQDHLRARIDPREVRDLVSATIMNGDAQCNPAGRAYVVRMHDHPHKSDRAVRLTSISILAMWIAVGAISLGCSVYALVQAIPWRQSSDVINDTSAHDRRLS